MSSEPVTATAVALRYDGTGAPRVTARGRGEVAERILAIAREHQVPVREDRNLITGQNPASSKKVAELLLARLAD